MKLALKILILLGILLFPLINSRITNLLGFSFGLPVSGNYEFTKVMFFNIWSAGVFGVFAINLLFKKIRLPKFSALLFGVYFLLIATTYFSAAPYISFFGNTVKSHSFFMLSNLVLLYIVISSIFSNSGSISEGKQKAKLGENNFYSHIILCIIVSTIYVGIIGIKEYFWPMYSYGDLGNRLFSTFGHPNYVSIFFVSMLPFVIFFIKTQYKKSIANAVTYGILFLFLLFCLILTKSLLAIFLAILYISFEILQTLTRKKTSNKSDNNTPSSLSTILGVGGILLMIGALLVFFFLPEKLSSFVSRFYIWETVLKIISLDTKSFLLGHGAETLVYFFDNAKSEYLYIYENIGFTADRPHNIFLNFFFHFGIGGFLLIVLFYKKIILLFHSIFLSNTGGTNNIGLLGPTVIASLLISLFLLLNYASIALYVILVIMLAYIINNTDSEGKTSSKFSIEFCIIPLLVISLFGAFNSYNFYISETYAYNNKLIVAKGIYEYNPINYYYSKDFDRGNLLTNGNDTAYYYASLAFEKNPINKKNICNNFVEQFHYAETYIYCGNHLWKYNQEDAREFYSEALALLPDLWNTESDYYKEFGVKHFKVNGNRFLSEKYGLAQVLERMGIK